MIVSVLSSTRLTVFRGISRNDLWMRAALSCSTFSSLLTSSGLMLKPPPRALGKFTAKPVYLNLSVN